MKAKEEACAIVMRYLDRMGIATFDSNEEQLVNEIVGVIRRRGDRSLRRTFVTVRGFAR